LLNGFPELLKEEALLWYRNSRDQWHSWEEFCTDFREYYLSRRYRTKLVREIQGRLQLPEEPYRKFVTEVTTMMRRAGEYSVKNSWIYYMKICTRAINYIYRASVYTDPLIFCGGRTKLKTWKPSAKNGGRTTIPPPSPPPRAECCWQCKQRGHTRFICQRIPKKFCSQCGKDGVFIRYEIRYLPRPHVVKIQGYEFDALLDTGSEATFVNEKVAELHSSKQGVPARARRDEYG